MKHILALGVLASALLAQGEVKFDAGGDVRIREELMENVPGMPGGSVWGPTVANAFRNHMRFRARVWGETRLEKEGFGMLRLYVRLNDECRWCPEPYINKTTFPDEVILDNLYLEGKGFFDGFLDFVLGRQDIYGLYGLDHIFVDPSPGDGSRSVYSEMARTCLHFTEETKLDLFAMYDFDDSEVRWGTDRGKHRSLSGLQGGADPDMDDWGFGAILGSNLGEAMPYQLFVMQKNADTYYRGEKKVPRTQRELMGFKIMPQLDEEWSLQFEGMSQVGANGCGDMLTGWSGYSGINWKSATDSSVKPFAKLGYLYRSGSDDAADEEGGHSGWDPMWDRGVNESEMMLYGSNYGLGWWSNMHRVRLEGGLDLGAHHSVSAVVAPMFAANQDGRGGGDGMFMGLMSQLRYDFPIMVADKKKGERFEIFGHLLAEFFNPGDYFETEKPAYFIRWQIDFKF